MIFKILVIICYMKLSTKSRYALRALVDLAFNQEGSPITLKEIANRQKISLKYLEHMFNTLKGAGFIKSQRGAHGGYKLAKPAAQISANDVVCSIDGPVSIVDCCTATDYCDQQSGCKTHALWKRINDGITAELTGTTIADLQ